MKEEITKVFNTHKDQIKKLIRKTIPEVYDFRISTTFEDTKLSFDCIFHNYKNNKNTKVSIRLRNYYYRRYNDITIRSRSQHDFQTEYDKLINFDTTDHLYFYGVLNPSEDTIIKGYLIDVDRMKKYGLLQTPDGHYENTNEKGTDNTEFYTYNIERLFYHFCVISCFGIDKEKIKKLINIYKNDLKNGQKTIERHYDGQ